MALVRAAPATWMYYALSEEVQPLGPPKSQSGKLATIFKLPHYRAIVSLAIPW